MVGSADVADVEIAYDALGREVGLIPFTDPGLPAGGEVRVQTLRVGFCGTDREIARGSHGIPPPGASHLVLGHEMVGVVAEVGEGSGLKTGDIVAAMVRQGCGRCVPCLAGRADYCLTGDYLEHGIRGLDGFARPVVVLPQDMVVVVASTLVDVAVLTEPLSVVCKALEEARFVRSRIPTGSGTAPGDVIATRVLVAGVGTIGLLATYLLTGLGFRVTVIGVRDPDSLAPQLVHAAGAEYVHATKDRPVEAVAAAGPADIVIEAAGDARLAVELFSGLAPGGVIVWLGVPGNGRVIEFDAARALGRAVAGHHALVASVNASRRHFVDAAKILDQLASRPRFSEIVTSVLEPAEFESAIWPAPGSIKQVVAYGP